MRKGLSYITLDCEDSVALELIQAQLGLKGWGIAVKLKQRIFSEGGYYCTWNDDVALVFAQRNGVSAGVVSETVNVCFTRGFFDKSMFDSFGILTSKTIQEEFLVAAKRRQGEKIKPEHSLIKCAQNSKDVCNSSKNVYKNDKNVYNSEQSKEKKSKVEYSRVEERKEETCDAAETSVNCGKHGLVSLTDSAYQSLVSLSSKDIVDNYIDRYDEWCYKNNKPASKPYITISRWITQDKPAKGSEPSFDLDAFDKLCEATLEEVMQ